MDSHSRQDPLAIARDLGPAIAAASDTIERSRRIPEPLLSQLHESRLFRLLMPRSVGGEQTEPGVCFSVIEEFARNDASVGLTHADVIDLDVFEGPLVGKGHQPVALKPDVGLNAHPETFLSNGRAVVLEVNAHGVFLDDEGLVCVTGRRWRIARRRLCGQLRRGHEQGRS
jgi:hypothetical protein